MNVTIIDIVVSGTSVLSAGCSDWKAVLGEISLAE